MYARPHRTGLGSHGLGLSYATAGTPLVPFRVATRYGDALHDAIFGAKAGDPVTGGGPGNVYTTDQVGKFEAYSDPRYAGVLGANQKEADLFTAAVQAGWVPNTPVGLETLLSSIAEGYASGVARNGPGFDAFWSWFQSQQTGTPSASSGAPLAPPAAPVPDPAYPVGVQLLSRGDVGADSADIPGDTGFPNAVDGIIGARLMTRLNNGQVQVGPWVPTTRVLGVRFLDVGPSDPSQQKTGWYASRSTGAEGMPTVPLSRSERIPYSVPAHVKADEAALLAFVRGLGANVSAPAAWTGPLATIYQSAPIPVPPPGSQVFVPLPDSGKEPSIKLPGATEFVPISTVPPAVFNPVNWSGGGAPPVVVHEAEGETTPSGGPFAASVSGVNGFLLIGAVVGLMLLSGKRKT